jgi:hypothetical protein
MSMFMLVSVRCCNACYLWAAVAASVGHLQSCTPDRAAGCVSFWAAIPGNHCGAAESNMNLPDLADHVCHKANVAYMLHNSAYHGATGLVVAYCFA